MRTIYLHNKKAIEQELRKNVYLQIYSIGDLDDFFWPYTTWYALEDNVDIKAIALLYIGQAIPTLLAITEKPGHMCKLLTSISHLLPSQFYAHFSPGVKDAFSKEYQLESYGKHYKMALLNWNSSINNSKSSNTVPLGIENAEEIFEFYKECYPKNWFDPRMLETNQYFGIRDGERLVSVAGIHVYSPEYKVAALGNIATVASHRNKGYASLVTAMTCKSLFKKVEHIGLNVKADNDIAIACYRKLGFETVATYGEYMVRKI